MADDFSWLTSDMDEMHAELLRRSNPGKELLTKAHHAMGEVVAARIRRYAPRARGERSAASQFHGRLSDNVWVEADADGCDVYSPFYARFQDGGRYVFQAVADAMPDAAEAYGEVISKAVGRPGGGFLPEPAARTASFAAGAVELGTHLALGYIGLRRGQQIGAVTGAATMGALRGNFFPGIKVARTAVRQVRSSQKALSAFYHGPLGKSYKSVRYAQRNYSRVALQTFTATQAAARTAVQGVRSDTVGLGVRAAFNRRGPQALAQVGQRAKTFADDIKPAADPARGAAADLAAIWR